MNPGAGVAGAGASIVVSRRPTPSDGSRRCQLTSRRDQRDTSRTTSRPHEIDPNFTNSIKAQTAYLPEEVPDLPPLGIELPRQTASHFE
jgi:hypothetical protein